MIVDRHMDELPADAAAVALPFAVAGDAMADPVEAAELLDVDVDHLAGPCALVAPYRRRRLDRIDAVIVNPTYMIGPRDARPSSGKLVIKIAKRQVPGTTPGYNNFVDVRDVARGMILAWQKGKRGERYILAGHDMTYRAVFEKIAALAGVAPPRLPAPRLVARLVGAWGDLVEARGGEPVVNSTQVRYAYTDRFRFASTKAKTELGYTYGPLEPAITDALDWFRARHMV